MNGLWRILGVATALLLAACAESPLLPPAQNTPTAGTASRTSPTNPNAGSAHAKAPASASSPSPLTKRGGAFYKDDGPGDNPPPDMASIPDAEPRTEPLMASANRPYNALGQDYVPMQQIQPYSKRGVASWYGRRFNGKRTSSGEPYDMYAMTAAHPTLPIPSYVRVTNLANDKSVIVRINDRGPFHSSRIIDLSYTAAWKLGYADRGSSEVLVESIVPDEMDIVTASIGGKTAKKPSAPASQPIVASAPVSDALTAAGVVPTSTVVNNSGVSNVTGAGSIYLQLGAFASKANAESFRDYVQGELKWLTQDMTSHFGGDKYRLNLGPFQSVEEARDVAGKIAQSIKLKPFLVMR